MSLAVQVTNILMQLSLHRSTMKSYFTGGCFIDCTGLTEIVFPEGTTYVDDDAFDGESRTVDVHIRTLRQKLGVAADLIETIRGVGYKLGGAK